LLSLSYGRIIEKDIDSSEGLLPESFETYQIVQPNDMVFRFTDLQNDQRSLRSALVKDKGIITSAYLAFRPNEQVLVPRFLDYLMRAYDLSKVFYPLGGGVRQSLKFDDVKRLGIIVPPLDEQMAIADFLDRELAQINLLQQKESALVNLLVERRSEVLNTTTSNPEMLDSWKTFKISQLATLINGYPFDAELFVSNGEVPLVRIRDIKADSFESFISKEVVPRQAWIEDGDLLVGMDGDFNNVLWTRGPAALNQRVALLRFDSIEMAKFVNFAISHKLQEINIFTYSTTVKHLSSGQIKNIKMQVPPSNELGKIVGELERKVNAIDLLIDKAKTKLDLVNERRQSLISAAVTGKIDVRKVA
jgi:type I restriction enzyme S subunit